MVCFPCCFELFISVRSVRAQLCSQADLGLSPQFASIYVISLSLCFLTCAKQRQCFPCCVAVKITCGVRTKHLAYLMAAVFGITAVLLLRADGLVISGAVSECRDLFLSSTPGARTLVAQVFTLES